MTVRSRIRVAGALIAAVALAVVEVQSACGTGRPDRNALWRTIFARPSEPPPGGVPEARQVLLGRDLFNDARLSGRGSASCATCHDEQRAFTDGRAVAQGPLGNLLTRNSPQLFDLAWATAFFWDGRAPSLTAQARFPILAPDELAGDFKTIVEKLTADSSMVQQFRAAFPLKPVISEETLLEALAAYERSLVSPKTRFDQWVEGNDAVLSEEEKDGFAIFVGRGGCVGCHGGWRFTDGALHDIGLPLQSLTEDDRAGVARRVQFKTPSLRELTRTAPYMHDGSKATLDDVVAHYTGGLSPRPTLASAVIRDLSLTKVEKDALVAFLKALSSDASLQRNP